MKVSDAIKTAGEITIKNIAIFQTLFLSCALFVILLSTAQNMLANKTLLLVYLFLLFLVISALESGWINMIKKAISVELDTELNEQEKIAEHFHTFNRFFPGIGEYFAPYIFWQFLYFIITFLLLGLLNPVGKLLFTKSGIDVTKIESLVTPNEMANYLQTLDPTQIATITLFGMLSILIIAALLFWWLPALFYKSKNPFVALKENFIFLTKHLLQTIGIILFIFALYLVVSLVSAILGGNIILEFIKMLIGTYSVTYFVVLIFLYYGQNGEQTAKDNIDSGDDCDGEKLAGNSSSEEA